MFEIHSSKKEVLDDLPFVQDWLDMINKLEPNVKDSDIYFSYSYGYFVPVVDEKDKDEFYNKMYDEIESMLYTDRLKFELSKVRTDLIIETKKMTLTKRLDKGIVPNTIKDIVGEVTKVKMLIEYEYNKNIVVKESIPEVDKSIISYEIIKDTTDFIDVDSSVEVSLDNILEKIKSEGIGSLSKVEKEFLDKKSKE